MNQLPAHLQHRQSRSLTTQAVGGINQGSPAHISIAGNRFTLIDDAGNEKPIQTLFLDVCVIDANAAVSKIFFDPRIPFEPGGDNSNPPICWSDNGIGASAQASQPQNASCQLCPQNAWGSATSKATGKPVKACNDVKKVAVIVPGIDMVFLLRIPPASLKNWGKYCNTLAGHGVDLPDAVTRLEFESQGILKFEPKGYVDAATAAATDKAIAAKATDNLVGRNDRPWGGQGEAQKIEYAQRQAPAQPIMAPPPQPFGQPVASTSAPFAASSPTPTAPGFGTASHTAPPASPFEQQAGAGPFAQAGTSSQMAASPQGPAASPVPRRTRGPNKPKPDAQTAAAMNTGAIDDGIPPFLRRSEPPVTTQNVAPNPTQFGQTPQTQFGMTSNPPAPDAGVQAALDAAFRLPT